MKYISAVPPNDDKILRKKNNEENSKLHTKTKLQFVGTVYNTVIQCFTRNIYSLSIICSYTIY